MRKLTIVVALIATLVAMPAQARDDAVYVELEHAIAGTMKVNHLNIDVGTTPDAAQAFHNRGWDVGGIVGYDFGRFRLEGEVSWRKAKVYALSSVVRIPSNTALSPTSPTGTFATEFSEMSAGSLMLNGLVDIGNDNSIQVYAGGGVGFAAVKGQYSINRLGPGWISDTNTAFAWQGLVGVRYPVGNRVDLGLKYRFFNASDVDWVDTGGRAIQTDLRTQSLMFTVGYNF
jgi:OmpA-OmpF porin, OOP family